MAGLDPSILAALKDSSAEDRARRAAKRDEGKVDGDKGAVNSRSPVNQRSPTNPLNLRPSLEAMRVQPQGLNQAQGAQDRERGRLGPWERAPALDSPSAF